MSPAEPTMPYADDVRRLAQVHPTDWVNPTPAARYHLVVIGAGTAGLVTAAAAAGLGAKVALIERHLMGGDCLNVGCVPSKGLIAGARAWSAAGRAATFGLTTERVAADARVTFDRMRKLRADIAPIDGAPRFASLGIDVFIGDGAFTAPDRISVGGATLNFRRAVIATGARAAMPEIPGLSDAGAHTNETIFDLPTVPKRLAVIGGGPIGCELAQACAALGSVVTLFTDSPAVLPREDPDAARIITQALIAAGVTVVAGAVVTQIVRTGDERTISANVGLEVVTHTVDAILVATGRKPNIEGMGLDRAGVAVSTAGVIVDDHLRTSNHRVYAAGDVCSRFQFTHAADFMARTVVRNALFFGRAKASRLVIPWVTYTTPEVAHVGITSAEAAVLGANVTTVTVPMDDVDRARLDGTPEGFLRLYLKAGTDTILGGTLVAEHAGEMIGELVLAMTARIGLGMIGNTVHPYPTQAEIFRKAADQWRRGALTPPVKKLFALFFKLFS